MTPTAQRALFAIAFIFIAFAVSSTASAQTGTITFPTPSYTETNQNSTINVAGSFTQPAGTTPAPYYAIASITNTNGTKFTGTAQVVGTNGPPVTNWSFDISVQTNWQAGDDMLTATVTVQVYSKGNQKCGKPFTSTYLVDF